MSVLVRGRGTTPEIEAWTWNAKDAERVWRMPLWPGSYELEILGPHSEFARRFDIRIRAGAVTAFVPKLRHVPARGYLPPGFGRLRVALRNLDRAPLREEVVRIWRAQDDDPDSLVEIAVDRTDDEGIAEFVVRPDRYVVVVDSERRTVEVPLGSDVDLDFGQGAYGEVWVRVPGTPRFAPVVETTSGNRRVGCVRAPRIHFVPRGTYRLKLFAYPRDDAFHEQEVTVRPAECTIVDLDLPTGSLDICCKSEGKQLYHSTSSVTVESLEGGELFGLAYVFDRWGAPAIREDGIEYYERNLVARFLEPGEYVVRIRGDDWHEATREVTVGTDEERVELVVRRR